MAASIILKPEEVNKSLANTCLMFSLMLFLLFMNINSHVFPEFIHGNNMVRFTQKGDK